MCNSIVHLHISRGKREKEDQENNIVSIEFASLNKTLLKLADHQSASQSVYEPRPSLITVGCKLHWLRMKSCLYSADEKPESHYVQKRFRKFALNPSCLQIKCQLELLLEICTLPDDWFRIMFSLGYTVRVNVVTWRLRIRESIVCTCVHVHNNNTVHYFDKDPPLTECYRYAIKAVYITRACECIIKFITE